MSQKSYTVSDIISYIFVLRSKFVRKQAIDTNTAVIVLSNSLFPPSALSFSHSLTRTHERPDYTPIQMKTDLCKMIKGLA